MMAWTNRHCRYLLRLTARSPWLFTEMITTGALLHGPRKRLLSHDPKEHPLVIQLGGSESEALAEAARLAAAQGFIEINLNIGCPSARVQSGAFGACLMREPELVARMVQAISRAVSLPVSVKCRLGVDDHDSQPLLEDFVARVADAGCRKFYIHARKALLNGISPAQNRQIPPLQYNRVYDLKARFPELTIILNGGIGDSESAVRHLRFVDGVMIGRQAYQQPLFMNELAGLLFDEAPVDAFTVLVGYRDYMAGELDRGTRLADMTRHCLSLFNGVPGAKSYRRLLSDQRRLKFNDLNLIDEAISCVFAKAA
jgi:tRNA-dihydrouridine synthase A